MSTWIKIAGLAKRSLIVLVLTLGIANGLYFGLDYFKEGLNAELAQLVQTESSSQTKWATKQADLASLQANMDQYTKLREQGLVGAADRVGWTEQLVLSRQNMDLPDTLTYTLLPPQSNVVQTKAVSGAAPVDTSTAASNTPQFHDLEFSISEIQEEELLALLHDYQNKVKGRFRVNSCTFSDRTAVGMLARCFLRFYTIPPGAS
jgi:hypothetical protein